VCNLLTFLLVILLVELMLNGDHYLKLFCCRSQSEDVSETDKHNYPGYHDFMSSSAKGAKKRVLPVAPQQRRVMLQNSLADSFEESYAEKVTTTPSIAMYGFVLLL